MADYTSVFQGICRKQGFRVDRNTDETISAGSEEFNQQSINIFSVNG